MYCVIQELQNRKLNQYGAHKELGVFTNPFNIKPYPQYGYFEMGERFERPIRTVYKIAVHESKRVNGVVTKKQFVVTTVDFYTLATGTFTLGDYEDKIIIISEKLNAGFGVVCDMLDEKISSLQERLKADFEKTVEYKTEASHREIIALYKEAKARFSDMYECPVSEYDYCFNVFGELMNADYYEKVKSDYQERAKRVQYNRSLLRTSEASSGPQAGTATQNRSH